MPVIAFYTSCKGESGNTTSAISLAAYLGIEKNKKTLLISTELNDSIVHDAFWKEQPKKKSGLFGPNTSSISQNGIEGLDRIIRSNRITPEIIKDYTRVVLTNRFDILMGYNGSDAQYKEIQRQYPQIVTLASKCYDTVIIDIDKQLEQSTQNEIVNSADIVVATTTQRLKDIQNIVDAMEERNLLKPENTLLLLGRYNENLKYNAKNVTRTFFRKKDTVNTVPYNALLFEALQEGKIIDLFLKFLSLKGKDENTFLIDELRRLGESIDNKQLEIQMKS